MTFAAPFCKAEECNASYIKEKIGRDIHLMASKVLSIEIGQGLTRVAEIDYKVKNPKIYNIFSLTTPPDMLNDGKVTVNDVFVSQLSNELRTHMISTKKVVFVMNSTRVANRVIQIPFVKENRVADLLNANASDYFPVDMNQYDLVHETMGTIEDGGEKKLELSVLAIPKELIESYKELAKACGLTLEGLDYIGNSIKKMMLKEIPEDIRATLKVEENSSILTVMEDGVVKLQRTINYGVADAIDTAIDSQVFGYAIDTLQAVKELSRRTCLYYSFDKMETSAENIDGLDKKKLQTLRTDITENFRTLIGSTSRILDYYQSQHPDKRIEKIYLVGLGSIISGLSRLMTNELNYKVVANQQYNDISLAKNAEDEAVHIAEYFTTIGAAMDPVSVDVTDKKSEKASKKSDDASAALSTGIPLPVAILLLFICIVICVVLSAYVYITNAALKTQQNNLNTQIDQNSYIEAIVAEYNAAVADEQWVLQLDSVTTSNNENLVALIEELEEKMPTSITVLSLSASDDSISMNITVDSKSAAADVVSQLRTFSSIEAESIAISTISDATDEYGLSTVSLSVSCNYATQEVEETEGVISGTEGTDSSASESEDSDDTDLTE
jgi:type IV pilus assembly protein PilM